MSAKDLIIEFINLILIIILVAFCIFYFIAGAHSAVFVNLMKAMVSLSFFGILFLIKFRIDRREMTRRKKDNNMDIVLYLTFLDKMISNIIVFLTPIVLGLLIYFAQRSLDAFDLFLLIIIFIIMYFWQKFIFDKER